MEQVTQVSSGFTGFDKIINNLNLGDNVVWQVDSIADYREFVIPFADKAYADGRKILYMRFASHSPLFEPGDARVKIHTLNAFSGFEAFALEVHRIIAEAGEKAFYVFDSLSDLLSAWATDLLIGNFFTITCPYLFELDTVAYFAILRNSHDYKTIARIRETTQLLIDIHNFEGNIFVHPLKVWNRYSPTMFFPHKKERYSFHPILNSADVADFITYLQRLTTETTRRSLDFWDKLFIDVEDMIARNLSEDDRTMMLNRLCRLIIGRDDRILDLAVKNFRLEDFASINSRLIGSGFIGGKAAGMLIARKILDNDSDNQWNKILEPHDSFFIGSDVFYTYIVQNGLWKLFLEHKSGDGYFKTAPILRERMLHGTFPDEVKEQLHRIIEYFGQSPFIVRSSSLLEDTYGHAFAGKYESHFCVNQGSPEERYNEFINAIRMVYASTMNEDALAYRMQRGLDKHDEQMALMVQRVSGAHRGNYFFPYIGGVGLSYNTYVWKSDMDPEAGMLRMVFGLGTRSVDRVVGDYPRIVALDSPLLRVHSGIDDLRKFSQHNVDVLNIEKNIIETVPLVRLLNEVPDLNMEMAAISDYETANLIREMNLKDSTHWVISFDNFFSSTDFSVEMQKILKTLKEKYNYPVDIEFTVNFSSDNKYRINLLQCRPYQAKGIEKGVLIPDNINDKNIFIKSDGNFLGGSVIQPIDRIIYVEPEKYSALSRSDKYEVARIVGRLNRLIPENGTIAVMLIGPGRWGTTTPELGVPSRFSEINNVKVLVEMARMSENIMPELSFGSHFFHDLVETGIFYIALFPENQDVLFNIDIFNNCSNLLNEIIHDASAYSDVVKVFDARDKDFSLIADISSQKLICFSNVTAL
ncbi:MAG TPA: PEP/pyruvate-binding domain-containing protein [Spirochaetota bacterium]|nr:PEP/pyruvate-binding domain-containing protein [Spirochaetota bacterium]